MLMGPHSNSISEPEHLGKGWESGTGVQIDEELPGAGSTVLSLECDLL